MPVRPYAFVVELADAGSFRRAAENLSVTHTALVHSIKALENRYGVRLFDRGRGVKAKPTVLGEIFISHARQILQIEEDLIFDLRRGLDPGSGILNVAIGPFPQNISGQEAIGRMIARYPDLQIRNSVRQYNQAVRLILERKVDIAIAETSFRNRHPELVAEPLGRHIAGFFCRPGHPLVMKQDLTIEDLVEFPWCCTRMPSRVRDFLPSDMRRAGRIDPLTNEVVPAIEVDSLAGIETLIDGGDALVLSSLVTLKDELESRELVLLPFRDAWLATNYGFISLQGRAVSPAAKEFMAEIRAIEADQFEVERRLIADYFEVASRGR